jgi:seryl-tRNA synthetase
MIPIQQIRQNKELIIRRLNIRGMDYSEIINELLSLDEAWRMKQHEMEETKSQLNLLSSEIGNLYKSGNTVEADFKKHETTTLKEELKEQEVLVKSLAEDIQELMYEIPNAPSIDVPEGKTPEENVEVYKWGEPVSLDKDALPHWDLAKKYNIIDFELGNKITGAGFPVYLGKGARLQRGLINFFLDEAVKAGFTEVQPPILVNEASGIGTGQLPDKEGQMYFVGEDMLYLIPTAEVPITNLYRDVIIEEKDLPIKNVGYTPCFRREAGSYGAHVRGLNRLHQFDKVEIVQISTPEQSYQLLEEMVEHVKGLMKKMGLHFRVIRLCGGDMGFASAMTYDFEIYSAAQQRWLEISSVSNFESFQSNRLKLRYKDSKGNKELAHTLNGSALALPRLVAGLLEANQSSKGIKMPECLVPYLGFEYIT